MKKRLLSALLFTAALSPPGGRADAPRTTRPGRLRHTTGTPNKRRRDRRRQRRRFAGRGLEEDHPVREDSRRAAQIFGLCTDRLHLPDQRRGNGRQKFVVVQRQAHASDPHGRHLPHVRLQDAVRGLLQLGRPAGQGAHHRAGHVPAGQNPPPDTHLGPVSSPFR